MREILEQKLFPFVEKPARYIGRELGMVVKDSKGLVNIALGYPDLYEVGMSYAGGQLLYNLINRRFNDPNHPGKENEILEFLMALAFAAQKNNRKTIEIVDKKVLNSIAEFG